MDEKIEILRVELTNVSGEDTWLQTFSDILELEIPQKLVKHFNTTAGGCLKESHMPKTKVECWPVDRNEENTPLEECELDFVME